MIRSLFLACLLILASAVACQAQTSDTGATSQADGGKPSTAKPDETVNKDSSKASTSTAKKPKKVWTNEEMSSVRGTISVVGDPAIRSQEAAERLTEQASAGDAREKQVAACRDQLRKLNMQLEAIDKQIADLRNFKGENTSASGGISVEHRYSMTPMEEQIRQLEEKKKQIHGQIDTVEEAARKSGIEPGELR